jgi:hypothetical protein
MMTWRVGMGVCVGLIVAGLATSGRAEDRMPHKVVLENPTEIILRNPTEIGRYQYFEGAVPKVFDTQTGRVYLLLPGDEKTQTKPYLFIQDPVAGTGTTVIIKPAYQTGN